MEDMTILFVMMLTVCCVLCRGVMERINCMDNNQGTELRQYTSHDIM